MGQGEPAWAGAGPRGNSGIRWGSSGRELWLGQNTQVLKVVEKQSWGDHSLLQGVVPGIETQGKQRLPDLHCRNNKEMFWSWGRGAEIKGSPFRHLATQLEGRDSKSHW